eukprot:CAMPEP_0172750256 /NCGR_PEP_ID=MMETSP1074-20121228/149203_1 /TAXON_ID=2916 /ORGANISM="Ceratium fusus, Strain PA161109" /LENGTH=38 /DNA_ID= /DNA_START= /DNA_END= /DNA_ORIENTATION=
MRGRLITGGYIRSVSRTTPHNVGQDAAAVRDSCGLAPS